RDGEALGLDEVAGSPDAQRSAGRGDEPARDEPGRPGLREPEERRAERLDGQQARAQALAAEGVTHRAGARRSARPVAAPRAPAQAHDLPEPLAQALLELGVRAHLDAIGLEELLELLERGLGRSIGDRVLARLAAQCNPPRVETAAAAASPRECAPHRSI